METFDDIEDSTECPRCGCCEMFWESCDYCGGEGGQDGYELMEEDPLWYGPKDYRACDACNGKGGYWMCIGGCDSRGQHEHALKTSPGGSLRESEG